MIKSWIPRVAMALSILAASCTPSEQMAMFIKQMDNAPAADRPPNWEETKRLMARPAPDAGVVAPDFSLPRLDGMQSITMSRHRGDRPLVLIFGSFT